MEVTVGAITSNESSFYCLGTDAGLQDIDIASEIMCLGPACQKPDMPIMYCLFMLIVYP